MNEPGQLPARQRRPRLEDVASRAGVSTATASLVLRGAPGPGSQSRERVLQVAEELGYRADRTASLLARRRAHLIGVAVEIRNAFHAELVEGIQEAAERCGYDVVLSTLSPSRDEQRAVETLVDFRCEALILLGSEAPAARLESLAADVPLVVVGRRIPSSSLDVVRSADDQGIRQAVDHLVELGHRDIALIDGGKGQIAADRRRGYRTAMRRRHLEDRLRIIPGDHTESGGAGAAKSSLERPDRPTAIIAFNDRSAFGVLEALSRSGVEVPGAMSVVGYDDSPGASLPGVNLTTVSQDAAAQAQHAVAAAVQRLDEGRTAPSEVVLPPTLVVRGTTAPPPRTQ